MKKITKKIWPEFFEKILNGEKKYELRLGDFDCQTGDILVLREWDPNTKAYTGRQIEREITLVLKTKDQKFWPEADVNKYGFQILSLK